jgi:hypothetical protein
MLRTAALIAGGFLASLSAGWLVLPATLYRTVPQPFQFSHLAHTGEKGGMSCQDCHALRDDGSFAGIPKLESCANCHAEPMGATEAEKKFVADFVKPGREPQWNVYSRQPANAFFPHAAHVKAGGIRCETCHGGHGKSTALPAYRVNRLTGYSLQVMGPSARAAGWQSGAHHGPAGGMRMDDCISCHRQKSLRHSCLDCHK